MSRRPSYPVGVTEDSAGPSSVPEIPQSGAIFRRFAVDRDHYWLLGLGSPHLVAGGASSNHVVIWRPMLRYFDPATCTGTAPRAFPIVDSVERAPEELRLPLLVACKEMRWIATHQIVRRQDLPDHLLRLMGQQLESFSLDLDEALRALAPRLLALSDDVPAGWRPSPVLDAGPAAVPNHRRAIQRAQWLPSRGGEMTR